MKGILKMNCQKFSNLLFLLRKEKNLTQQNIADKLHISNKTVSKWERGLGFPDILLLPKLSKLLDVDIEKMLKGDLESSQKDIGKINKINFYVCNNCENTIVSTTESDIFCCGRKIEKNKIIENNSDITINEFENEFFIKIDHEMKKNHYISFICIVYFDKYLFIKLYPEQFAETYIPYIRKKFDIYYYCNNHGLFRKKFKK